MYRDTLNTNFSILTIQFVGLANKSRYMAFTKTIPDSIIIYN